MICVREKYGMGKIPSIFYFLSTCTNINEASAALVPCGRGPESRFYSTMRFLQIIKIVVILSGGIMEVELNSSMLFQISGPWRLLPTCETTWAERLPVAGFLLLAFPREWIRSRGAYTYAKPSRTSMCSQYRAGSGTVPPRGAKFQI